MTMRDPIGPRLKNGDTAFYAAVGQRVFKLRHAHGLTTSELAKRVGITDNTLRNVERGITALSLHAARALAYEFDITVDEIAADDDAESA